MTAEQISVERKAFEEAAFGAYFLSTIVRNPAPRFADDLISEGCVTKAEFCALDENGRYQTATLQVAWWAWQKRAEASADPDLLEACKQALNYINEVPPGSSRLEAMLGAAIAKAEGGTNVRS